MDLKQLQYFVVSVDSGSFKKAAETLYTSQPHISKTVKSLETELQVELLERKARGVEVTKTGRKVYEYACQVLVEAGKIQNIQKDTDVHILRIAANSSDYLTCLFRKFYTDQLSCKIHARYTECGMEEIFRLVHRHTADLGFVHVDEKQMLAFRQMLEYRHLEFAELGKTEPLLFAGPKNSLYTMPFVTMKELRDLKYVQLFDEQDTLSIRLLQGNEDYQYYRRRGQVLITSSKELVAQTVLETQLCNISCGMFPDLIGYKEIHGIPIRGTEESITFGYVYRRRDGISSEAKQFVEYVKKEYDHDF